MLEVGLFALRFGMNRVQSRDFGGVMLVVEIVFKSCTLDSATAPASCCHGDNIKKLTGGFYK